MFDLSTQEERQREEGHDHGHQDGEPELRRETALHGGYCIAGSGLSDINA